MNMKRNRLLPAGAGALLLGLSGAGLAQDNGEERIRREMGVSAGPERVFSVPVEEVMPALVGATATGRNGRVGNELVFWSYRLADGRDALFYACADLPDVDCAGRAQKICPAGQAPVFSGQGMAPGEVRRLNCRFVGTAAPGELHPNCAKIDEVNALLVGMATCQ